MSDVNMNNTADEPITHERDIESEAHASNNSPTQHLSLP